MKEFSKSVFGTLLVIGLLLSFVSVISISASEIESTWDPTLGWDFQCHSHTHPHLQGLTASEISWEMEQVDVAFQAQGYSTPDHHAYPYGGWDQDVKAVVSQYRLTARMVWGFMVTYPVPDWHELKAAQLKRTTSWNKIKGWINDCIDDQALLHIFTHEVSDSSDQYGTTPEKLVQLLDYLLEKQNAGLLTVVTMAEAYDYWITATEGEAMVVVSFDDAYVTDYTTVYPLFQERGLKGTSYIVTSWIGEPDRLTWAMIDEMRTGTSPPPKPDLTLTSNDIMFVPETPSEGENVTITATIHNIGTETANSTIVGFYDGTPSPETLIGTDTITMILAGETGSASIVWNAISGDHEIYVIADPDNLISEINENNNQATKTLIISGNGGIMHVDDITLTGSSKSVFHRAHATITIVDDNNNPVSGATVYGAWSGVYSGTASGVTDANGQITLNSGKVKNGGTFTFTVNTVTKTDWIYDPTKNVETTDSIIYP